MASIATRLRDAFDKMLSRLHRRIDYLASYRYDLLSQNEDGTLELVSQDARLPNLHTVPIRYGVPGISAKLTEGGTVLVGFEAGSPTAPYATLFDSSVVQELRITSTGKIICQAESVELSEGGRKLALAGDFVQVAIPSLTRPITAMFGLPGVPPVTLPVPPLPLTAVTGVALGVPYSIFFYRSPVEAFANIPGTLSGMVIGTSVHKG